MQEDIDGLLSSTPLGQTQRETEAPTTGETMPALEAVQRGNEFVIRLDLPGVDTDTVEVDISEDAVTVRGERRLDVQRGAGERTESRQRR